jgi:IS605 OrfB family transposase
MSRYRLCPTRAQELLLLDHCAHARYVWNLAVEQHAWWRPGRTIAPGFAEQCRQLTQARAELPPGTRTVVGIDRGVTVSAALSTGELLSIAGLRNTEAIRLRRLQRTLARASRTSNRRRRIKTKIARLKARETDRRKDWVEKTSTDLARRFDVIRVEDLDIRAMSRSARGTIAVPGRRVRQKAGLNRAIHAAGWGLLATRLEQKAPGRVEKVNPAYTSQRCSACGIVDAKARESQAVFRCRSCRYTDNADVNAARNIAAGRAVTARGGLPLGTPANREPQLLTSL